MALHALDEVLDVVDVAEPLPPADPVEFAVELAETWHAIHHDEGRLVGAALVLAWQLEKGWSSGQDRKNVAEDVY